MSFKNRKVYVPKEVELTINDVERLFKIYPDGTIYEVERTVRNARNMEELMFSVGSKKGPPYTVTRDTVKRVKNTYIEKLVFHKYLSDLEERQRKLEEEQTS